jgi:hypothetical protein
MKYTQQIVNIFVLWCFGTCSAHFRPRQYNNIFLKASLQRVKIVGVQRPHEHPRVKGC